jgi:hypothetical protein
VSTRAHVFVGPSLPVGARERFPGLTFHDPVAQGDVYRLVKSRPLCIGIIDGYFEHRASVWHKELLWAMSEGVHLFGAASMGALRAAELADFGMVGIGQIYRDFASGALSRDDEVALVHADRDLGFRPVSEALVNLRASLRLADAQRILSSAERRALELALAREFYPDRSYATLVRLAHEHLAKDTVARLAKWLEVAEHRIDQKRLDAAELLEHMGAFAGRDVPPLRVAWHFQHTDAWEQVRRTVAQAPDVVSLQPAEADDALADRARLRGLEIAAARHDGYVPSREDVNAAAAELRRRRGLLTPEAWRDFLETAGLSDARFEQLMQREACAKRARLLPSYDLAQEIAELALLEGLPSAPKSAVGEPS